MNVKLTRHAAELLEAAQAQRGEPAELILEHALETLVREQHLKGPEEISAAHENAVRDMLDFVNENRVHLGPGLSVKELIREGQRV